VFVSCVTCAALAVWALANEPLNIAPATTAMAIFRIESSSMYTCVKARPTSVNARHVTLIMNCSSRNKQHSEDGARRAEILEFRRQNPSASLCAMEFRRQPKDDSAEIA
jgi:hypothetical protein